MIIEGDEMPNGWPLGLGNLNSRIRVADSNSPQPVAPTPTQPYASQILRSSSFSSFSSSNLDTESTASFFPDQSVSLGRLIGIRPGNKRGSRLYTELHNHQNISSSDDKYCSLGLRKTTTQEENSQGICVPLLHHVIGRMGRNGSGSRH